MKNIKILLVIVVIFTSCKSVKYKDIKEGVYADLITNKGDILLKLYAKDVPMTVGNFVSLAEGNHPKVTDSLQGKKYYNHTVFHRVVKGFITQGGDHTGTGRGNAGYFFPDEFPKDKNEKLLYKHDTKGVLSMANSGRNMNSNQFFITHEGTPWLDGKHTVFGKVVKGIAVIDSIKEGDSIKKIVILRIGKEAKKFDAIKAFKEGLNIAKIREKERIKKSAKIKKAFLKEMGIEKAKETSSGLKILILKKGKGKKVTSSLPVSAFYTFYTSEGVLIQSNIGKEPFKFTVDKRPLIAGWKEGVLTMREGDKVRLFIPSYLGFGDKSVGLIPTKSDLVFEIEVLKVGK